MGNFKAISMRLSTRSCVILFSILEVNGGNCKMGAISRQQCQNLCDITSYCEAWSFKESAKTCWMKKRTGWTVKPNPDFASGFKNNGPYYQANTNLSGGDYSCVQGSTKHCKVKAATNEECQALCDETEYCFAWSRGKVKNDQ